MVLSIKPDGPKRLSHNRMEASDEQLKSTGLGIVTLFGTWRYNRANSSITRTWPSPDQKSMTLSSGCAKSSMNSHSAARRRGAGKTDRVRHFYGEHTPEGFSLVRRASNC